MKDLLTDPLLYFATAVTLLFFGIAYLAAVVWSYNRDAQKHGKKSGCLPMILLLVVVSAVALINQL